MKLLRPLTVASASLLVGCGSHVRPALPPQPIAHVAAALPADLPVVTLPADPAADVIAAAEKEFAAGQSALELGHLVTAREHFDRAIDSLTERPSGARGDSRVQAQFERLVDRINALEMLALREGDGFSETRSEPAIIDKLLSSATFDRPDATVATGEAVADDLARTPHDLPIALNSKVLSYVELFQGNLRSFMEDGLERGSQYLPMIQEVFKSEGLPLDLAYLPLIESAFKNTALSRAAAKGMWQFELGTAKDYGLSQDWFLDERSDPEKATRAAAQHLKMLGQMFDGDWNMALASYNAGQGRILRAVKLSRQSDYWKLTSTPRYLPRETREYVPMVMAAIIIAKNPAQYGFDIDAVAPPQSEPVTIPNALDLRYIAEWTGVSIDDIRALNPELRRTLTPLGKHDLRVPLGTAAAVEASLATADPSIFKPINLYTVKKGDTLATVARKYKTSTTDLMAINDLKKGGRGTLPRLRVGQQLQVPVVPTTAAALAAATRKPASTTTTPPAAATTYRVKSGDTLTAIARQFAMSVEDLKRLNQLSSDNISVGDKLTVRRYINGNR